MSTEKKPLPTLADLHMDPETAFKNDKFKSLLNAPPKRDWIKKNKYANDSEYIPIDKIEHMLDLIFQEWKVEVKKTGQLLNSIEVTVRLHVKNPLTGEWVFHDGVGAEEISTKKDSGHLKGDLSNISPGAIKKALPVAKSLAIRDAADHLGRVFGRDLNRKDTVSDFVGSYEQTKARAEANEKKTLPDDHSKFDNL